MVCGLAFKTVLNDAAKQRCVLLGLTLVVVDAPLMSL